MIFYKFPYKMALEPYKAHNGGGKSIYEAGRTQGRDMVPQGTISCYRSALGGPVKGLLNGPSSVELHASSLHFRPSREG